MTRREALVAGAALGLAAVAGRAWAEEGAPATQPAKKAVVVGIQTGIPPLAEGDLDRTLADMREIGGVNALFPFIYTYQQVTAGMQGKGNFRGGNFAMPHMEYYKDTTLTYADMRAPDCGDLDVLAKLIPAAKKQGMKTFAWVLEDHAQMPSQAWAKMYEVDIHGKLATKHPAGACYNNPGFIGFTLGLIEDYTRSYDIDGVMWANERQGGLFNALGAWAHGASSDPAKATCFCEFCVKRGKAEGIDPERARAGFLELESYVKAGRKGVRPRDGYFVTFFRLLLKYPELLAWESLWTRSRFDLQKAIYKLVKSIKPGLPVGTHIWHTASFSPFHRAEMDYAEIATFTDFIKPVLYNNCAGERMKSAVESMSQNVFGDVPRAEGLGMMYEILNYQEAPYETLTETGFSADYVKRETARTVAGAGAGKDVWPGIDIDVPGVKGMHECTAEGVKAAVKGAFAGGATGMILSRNYPEMKREHLAGAGAALKELGVG